MSYIHFCHMFVRCVLTLQEHKLQVYVNRELRKIFQPRKDEVNGHLVCHMMKNLVIYTGHLTLLGQ